MDFVAQEMEYKLVCHLLNNFQSDRDVFPKLNFLDFQCPLLGKIYDGLKQVYDEGVQRKAEVYLNSNESALMLAKYIAKMGDSEVCLVCPEAYAIAIKEKSMQRNAEKIREKLSFDYELEDFCEYLEETAEQMRDSRFTREYSKQILDTINKQMNKLISLQ